MTPANTEMTDLARLPATARGDDDGPVAAILLSVLLALLAWAACIAVWGIPGLYVPALAMVPVIWILLIAISRG